MTFSLCALLRSTPFNLTSTAKTAAFGSGGLLEPLPFNEAIQHD